MIGSLSIPVFVTLLVGGILILVFVPLGIVFGVVLRQYRPNAAVLREGENAEATITRLWQTSVRVNSRFGVGLELEVRRPGYPPYTTTTHTLVGILDAPKFQIGQVVPVKVDPGRPERVYLNMLN
jgi:hypothetical protein